MKLRLLAKCMRKRARADVKLGIGVKVLSVGSGYRRVTSVGTLEVVVREGGVTVELWRERGVGEEGSGLGWPSARGVEGRWSTPTWRGTRSCRQLCDPGRRPSP